MRDSGISQRYDKLKREMQKQNFDVVIAISPENVLYFSETYIQTQKSIRLFARKTTMQTECLTVLSSPAIPYRFAATSL